MKTILAMLLLFGAGCKFDNKPSCSDYHDGKFVLNHGNGFVITRKGSYQMEQYKNQLIRWKLKWISDCEYEIRFLDVQNIMLPVAMKNMVGKVSIKKVEKDFCVIEFGVEGINHTTIDTMRKINSN
ncbi:MAG TPA: hypothetical protein VHK91_03835 [Flavisolibacter sp.]|jgi:hypothetical protein|nr:hypothetical protein [Flavisolibacter sp.]